MVADPFQIFADHQKIRAMFYVIGIVSHHFYQVGLHLYEKFVHDVIMRDYFTGFFGVPFHIGLHCVYEHEHRFRGHFPEYPVMPGVLIVEALAQVGAVSVLSLDENKGKLAFFGGIDKAKFRRQVRPGDRLRLEVEIIKCKGPMGVGHAVATVDGEKAAEAEIKFIIGS